MGFTCGVLSEKRGSERLHFQHERWGALRCRYSPFRDKAPLIETINSIFEEHGDKNMAHVAAIRAVKKELGDVSIKTFLNDHGAEKLKSMFDSVGVEAARTYSSKY